LYVFVKVRIILVLPIQLSSVLSGKVLTVNQRKKRRSMVLA
jgi:hypothetical protein